MAEPDGEVAGVTRTELVVAEATAQREERMITAAYAFVALLGGLGTLDERPETMTSCQLGYVTSLVVLVDAAFWRALVDLVDYTIHNGFAQPFSPT